MIPKLNHPPPEVATRARGFANLPLTDVEHAALVRQGSVSAEPRHRRSTVYKLRFRLDGRQVVKYLGIILPIPSRASSNSSYDSTNSTKLPVIRITYPLTIAIAPKVIV